MHDWWLIAELATEHSLLVFKLGQSDVGLYIVYSHNRVIFTCTPREFICSSGTGKIVRESLFPLGEAKHLWSMDCEV